MMPPANAVRALIALAVVPLLGGCREGIQPFSPQLREAGDSAWALTFGYGQDADPRWLPGGDTIIYHTNLFGAHTAGALLRIPVAGGSASWLLPDVQAAVARPLATPAVSPTGDRVAYMDLIRIDPLDTTCLRTDPGEDGTEATPNCRPLQPLLDSAVLRVRNRGSQGSMTADPHVGLRLSGTDPGHRFGSDGPWYERLFPFQADYRAEHAMIFRPSWAPDGQRIAFSDGLSLRIWRVGDTASVPVPNTTDGLSAAWSPDGQWIAFAHAPRTDSTVYTCACNVAFAFRTAYTTGPRTLVIVRPDGTGRTELGPGDDPAWSPDGAHIYARRGTGIVRVTVAGGAAVAIPHTTSGRAPAVSPDGSRLAFSRRKLQVTPDYDIWVVSLQP